MVFSCGHKDNGREWKSLDTPDGEGTPLRKNRPAKSLCEHMVDLSVSKCDLCANDLRPLKG